MFAALLWTYFEIPFHDAFTNGEMRTPNSCLRKPREMYLHSAELNVVAVTENVNTFLLVLTHVSRYGVN